MEKPNGNGWVTRWAIGSLWGGLVGVVLFMGNTVKGNDTTNVKEHTAIRAEVAERDAKLLEKIEKKMEEFQKDQIALRIQNAQILEIVKQLREKTQ